MDVPHNDAGHFDAPPVPSVSNQTEFFEYHPTVNKKPCDKDGCILPDRTSPPPFLHGPVDDYSPYDHHASFELADLLYHQTQMPAGGDSPFASTDDLYQTIDATAIGNMPWQSFTISYNGEMGVGEPPAWKTAQYEVFFHDPYVMLQNQLGNWDFANEMDFALKQVTNTKGKHCYQDFMSGNWAWKQAVYDTFIYNMISTDTFQDHISDDLGLEDITFVPVIASHSYIT
ncbi:hypothetical protein F5146DRAFT_1144731 [Armillaria mellea]|nr:hypothetical protein F5146DRAFT_1144731 [Armillaria mellea]